MPTISIVVRNRLTQQLETAELSNGETVPDYLHCFAHQWDHLSINQLSGYEASSLGKPVEIQTLTANRNPTQHSAIRILLGEETAITCKETGITASIRLSSTYGTNLDWLHPFALIENVTRILRQCQALGKLPHHRLSKNELAGMLLTLLRSKGLLRCKDATSANFYLQRASGPTLTLLLGYVANLSSTIGIPSISLLEVRLASHAPDWTIKENSEKSHAEVHLLNWKRDAEAAQKAFSRSKTSTSPLPSTKAVKVYRTDLTANQAKEVKDHTTKARKLLGVLRTRYVTLEGQATFFAKVSFALETMKFVPKDSRLVSATLIRSKLPASDSEAQELASIIGGLATDHLEKDLDGFSLDHHTTTKAPSLAEILAKKLGKGT